jgi:hypothetical protein
MLAIVAMIAQKYRLATRGQSKTQMSAGSQAQIL